MALSLTVADRRDASGITATVTGSDGGSTNTVYAVPVVQGYAPLVWRSVGTRTGDGTLVLPLTGYYYLYLSATVSSAPAVAPPVIGVGTLAELAVFTTIKQAVQVRVQGLTLTGLATPPGDLPPGRVYVFPVLAEPVLPQLVFPCVTVTAPEQGRETQPASLTGTDDIGYPVQVTILDRWAPAYSPPAATYELWRQQIFRAVRHQPIVMPMSVWTVTAEPGPIAEWRPAAAYQLFQSSIVFRAISREPRGV